MTRKVVVYNLSPTGDVDQRTVACNDGMFDVGVLQESGHPRRFISSRP